MVDEVKRIDLCYFMRQLGMPEGRRSGNKQFFKSPFNRDTIYSFCVYTDTNSFYDWSKGFGGSIIDLVMELHGCTFSEAVQILASGMNAHIPIRQFTEKKSDPKRTDPFDYTRYLATDSEMVQRIQEYAHSRKLYNGYLPGCYPFKVGDTFVNQPALMFLHHDVNLTVSGAKFRFIDNGKLRFLSKGSMGFFILENISPDNFGVPKLYIIEGEANAITLWQYLKNNCQNCVVISFGSVGFLPKTLPYVYEWLTERYLIIDYDGDDKFYKQRVSQYEYLKVKPITLYLEKKQDLNSLAMENKLNLIANLL